MNEPSLAASLDAIFTPVQVGSVTLKNRIIMTAMGGTSPFDETADGYAFKPEIRDYYMDRVKGGVALIIPGATNVWDIVNGQWLHESEDVFMGPIKELMDEIHAGGAKFFLQLGQGFGRVQFCHPGLEDKIDKMLYSTADGIPDVWYPELKTRAMTLKEIDDLVEAFAKSALLCKRAGIDGVELHAVHEGYLFDQFAIASMNPRTDEYGGSLENRMRYVTRVIRRIKELCGEDYPVSVRYSAASKMRGWNAGALPGEPYVEFGRSLEESPRVAQLLEEAGADMLDADNGSYDSWWWAHPPVYMPLHCNLPEVAYVKRFVKIPVFCAGRMEDPVVTGAAIAAGEIDGAGVARQFLCDPEWVNKAREGKLDDIRPCIACHNGCFAVGHVPDTSEPFYMSRCALNPRTFNENKYEITPAAAPKKVVVVGGGVGGMEAARIAALRGHDVTLYEKTDKLGGAFLAAAAPSFKEKDRMFLAWCKKQLYASGAKVVLNTVVTQAMLDELKADEVIVATGASPRKLPIQGIEKTVEAVDYLLGCQAVGSTVAIIGGGLTGCEIAYDLALQGKKPVILEVRPDILGVPGLCAANDDMLREIIRYYQIEVFTSAQIREVTDRGVRFTVDGQERFVEADSVIRSVGYVPDPALSSPARTTVIGDAARVKNLKSVIRAAWDVAFAI